MISARSWVLTPLLLLAPLVHAAQQLEVIDLHNRPANELVPILRPLVQPGDVISGDGFQLIIRAEPATIAEVRSLVQRLDKAPAQLLITVLHGSEEEVARRAAGIDGRIDMGNGSVVIDGRHDDPLVIRRSGPDSEINARITRTDKREQRDMTHSVRVLEGREAMIETGSAIPLQQRTTGPNGYREERIEYKDIGSGFYVTPRLSGNDLVTLSVVPYRQELQPHGGGKIRQQHAETTLTVRLGEWITLGGVSHTVQQREGTILRRTERTEDQSTVIRIKVERVGPR